MSPYRLKEGFDLVLTACSSDTRVSGDKPGNDYFWDANNRVKRDLEEDVRTPLAALNK
jgi:hypothetical protein